MKASKKPKIKGTQFYKIGDKVETIRPDIGAWFTADIIDILPNSKCECFEDCQCTYRLVLEGEEDTDFLVLDKKLNEIRQVSYSSIDWDKLKVGMKVVINYNIDKPKDWGFWYDYFIEDIQKRKDVYFLSGTLLVGNDGALQKLPVKIDSDNVADVLEIRPHATLQEKEMDCYETGTRPEYCKKCKNKPKTRCRSCCCCKCGNKKDFDLTVQCDECSDWYHIYCMKPPRKELPEDEDWYCPKCDNKAKCEKLEKQALKKQKRLSLNGTSSSKSKIRKSMTSTEKITEKSTEKSPEKTPEKSPQEASDEESTVNSIDEPNFNDGFGAIEVTKSIEKNSRIWNQVKELFPGYDLLELTAKVTKRREFQGFVSWAAEEFISNDIANQHLWQEAKQSLSKGKKEFLESVKRIFTCTICCELLNDPITLSCKHSFCIDCFFRSLSVNIYNCPLCRVDIIQTQHYVVNENLKRALDLLLKKKVKNI